MKLVCCTVALALGAAVRPAGAQRPISVTGAQSLTFGTLLPGVPTSVSRTDPARSGQFTLTGPHRGQASLVFTLPAVLLGPGGATLPVVFGAGDGGYSQSQTIGSQIGFDARQLFVITLSQQGRGSVYLGGTAQPGPTQRAGAYTGTIILTVATYP
jgi:hypothetical protein